MTEQAPLPFSKGMLYLTWLIVLGMLTWLFGNWEDEKRNPNRNLVSTESNGEIEVVLKRNHYGQYVLNGKINGKEATFLVDTGAYDVAMPVGMQQTFGLHRGYRGTAQTASGYTTTWSTNISTLEIGGIVLRDVEGSLLEDMPGDSILLGMKALGQLDMQQSGDTLTLRYRQ